MVWYPVSENGKCLDYGKKWTDLPYEEMGCLYPNTIGRTLFDWEKKPGPWFYSAWNWVIDNPWFPIITCGLYVFLIHWGQNAMKTREPWKWRKQLAGWNLFLSIFSIWGFFRLFPAMAHNFYYYSWKDNICQSSQQILGEGSTAFWGFLFAASKFVELFDTFFIVIHKKKLILLHWYHHITVLWCCWHSCVTETPTGLIFSTVNFGVHGVMYTYYYLMAIKRKPSWINPKIITITQIIQMIAGVVVTFSSLFFILTEENCAANRTNIIGTLVMYASYLVLFLNFFLERYGFKAKTVPKTKKVE